MYQMGEDSRIHDKEEPVGRHELASGGSLLK